MDNQLRNKIMEHLKSETEEPLEGHQQRFESRLDRSIPIHRKRNSNSTLWLGWIAACLIGLVLGVVYFSNPKEDVLLADASSNTTSLSEYSIEAGLKETFYSNELNKRKLNGDLRNHAELKEIFVVLDRLDLEYEQLNNKLKVNFHNEHVINAILENYRMRLEVMEKIQKIVKVKNRIKDTNHEKEML